jgi:hypothetical protein
VLIDVDGGVAVLVFDFYVGATGIGAVFNGFSIDCDVITRLGS